MMKNLKTGFTLVEVNLAMFIMAMGVLAMVSLYSLGFRESRQSSDDVASTGYADAFLAPVVMALSSTNCQWSAWKNFGQKPNGDVAKLCDGVYPTKGWSAYVRPPSNNRSMTFTVDSGCNATADRVFSELMSAARGNSQIGSLPTKPPYYAMVATRTGTTISIGFRASRRRDQLMSQPIYYTEVHFQGDPNN